MKRIAAVLAAAAVVVTGAVTAPAAADLPARPPRVRVPPDDWLGAVNHYRRQSRVDAVVADAARSEGIRLHLQYLANTPASLRTGVYANDHLENPASEWYTAAGDAAGRASNLGFGGNDRVAIEAWMAAPFHAIGILRPDLASSAFARTATGAAGLDVLRGRTAAEEHGLVLFPGAGSASFLDHRRAELPDPTEPCGGPFDGLPLIAMLPEPPPAGTTATLRTPDGHTLVEGGDLCVVTADRFTTTDSVYGATGSSILRDANAVLVIARRPLTAGAHSVTISGGGAELAAWSFTQVQTFDDIAGDEYFASPVRWLAANRITGGITDRLFGPGIDVTRGQLAALLHHFSGDPSPTAPLRYSDVPPDAYYATAVRWLDEQGITSGAGDTTFQPDALVTRGQMAAFLHRLAGSPAPSAPLRFTDVAPTAYYAAAVRWLDERGVADGVSASAFGPRGNVTRGQMAAFLYRLDRAVGS